MDMFAQPAQQPREVPAREVLLQPGPQRQRVLAASQQLVYQIVRAADTAVDFADLKRQFTESWDQYKQDYLHANLEIDRPTQLFVTKASDAALNPDNYSMAGRRMTF